MRLALFASSLSALLAAAAVAATGDALVVTGDGVNVRAEPSSRGSILLQIYRNEPAIELAREGEWVQVELTERATRGWVHQSLLAPAGPATTSPPAARSEPTTVEPQIVEPPPVEPPAVEPQIVEPPAAEPEPPVAATRPAPGAPIAPAPGAAAPEVTPGGVALGGIDAFSEFRKSVQYLNNRAVTVAGVDLFTDVRTAGGGAIQVVTTDAWDTMPESGQQSYLNALYNSWLLVAGPNGEHTVQIVGPDGDVVMEKSGP